MEEQEYIEQEYIEQEVSVNPALCDAVMEMAVEKFPEINLAELSNSLNFLADAIAEQIGLVRVENGES